MLLFFKIFLSQGEFKVTEREFTMDDLIRASNENRVWKALLVNIVSHSDVLLPCHAILHAERVTNPLKRRRRRPLLTLTYVAKSPSDDGNKTAQNAQSVTTIPLHARWCRLRAVSYFSLETRWNASARNEAYLYLFARRAWLWGKKHDRSRSSVGVPLTCNPHVQQLHSSTNLFSYCSNVFFKRHCCCSSSWPPIIGLPLLRSHLAP